MAIPIDEQLRSHIRVHTHRAGLTKHELCRRTGVDSGQLYRFLQRRKNLSLGKVNSICDELGLKLVKD